MVPGVISNGSPRAAMASAATVRCSPLNASRLASAAVRRSAFDELAGASDMRLRGGMTGSVRTELRKYLGGKQKKCEAAMAVGALDPGVPYESRWAPYDRIHGPGQGQFPKGSIRPRGYMAPDARRSFALAM